MSEQPEHLRWLALARGDLAHADSTLNGSDPVHRWVCLAAHQAAEKTFTAALIKDGVGFPRIHDLQRLQQLLPAGSPLRQVEADLASLTEWSIAGRYPADTRDAGKADAEQAVHDARAIVEAGAAMLVPESPDEDGTET